VVFAGRIRIVFVSISIFVGNIADAPADVVCTSTNSRMSLKMGTGGAIRERGGFTVLRECEAIVRDQAAHTGRATLPAGTVWSTTAGTLPFRMAIHCIASNDAHQSSDDVVRSCVRRALALARAAGCRSIAMPIFGTGHAHLRFARAATAMVGEIRDAGLDIVLVIPDGARKAELERIVGDG
jgi:O-acetyl-ADP-ribose deacetylase (regulator of RNase III)